MKYLNFPIELLKGFFDKPTSKTLDEVLNYAVYKISRDYNGTNAEKIQYARKFFNITKDLSEKHIIDGENLYCQYNKPTMTGISTKMFVDFYDKPKKEFEKVCLLAFLSFKSILGKKRYCKSNFNLLFARMNGLNKPLPTKEFTPCTVISKYQTKWFRRKFTTELENNWYLKYYAEDVRGFYFSFAKITREDLVAKSIKNSPEYKKMKRKKENQRLREELFNSL